MVEVGLWNRFFFDSLFFFLVSKAFKSESETWGKTQRPGCERRVTRRQTIKVGGLHWNECEEEKEKEQKKKRNKKNRAFKQTCRL